MRIILEFILRASLMELSVGKHGTHNFKVFIHLVIPSTPCCCFYVYRINDSLLRYKCQNNLICKPPENATVSFSKLYTIGLHLPCVLVLVIGVEGDKMCVVSGTRLLSCSCMLSTLCPCTCQMWGTIMRLQEQG